MQKFELQALREKRAKLLKDAEAELEKITDDTSEGEVEEIQQRFDKMWDEAKSMKERITRHEKVAEAADEMERVEDERRAGREPVQESKPADKEERQGMTYGEAFNAYLRNGPQTLTAEQRALLQTGFHVEQRAQSVGTDSAGGYTVPEQFSHQLEEALLSFGGVRSVATVFPTSMGGALQWPTVNDTAQTGERIAENAQHNEQDVTFGQLTLNDYLYSSKIVRVSWQLLQDSDFDIGAYLVRAFADRLGRIENTEFTTGTGSSQPNGIVTASTLGDTAASATAVTVDELIDLRQSVNSAYRPNAKWMFSDASMGAIMKLKDANNLPIFMPGYEAGRPDRILGHEFVINDDMPAMTTGLKSFLFGDFSKYLIRDVKGFTILRLTERYADYGQVGFLAFHRSDADLLDAGTNPVKHLIQA